MDKHFEVIGVSSHGRELTDVEKDEGIRTIALDMSREITPLQDMISLIKMIFLLLKEKPDIVHTHTPKAGIVGMVAAWLARVPHRLHTVAGLPVMEATGKKKKILLAVEKLTYACATKVYPNSYGLKTYILENVLAPENKLKIIGYGSSNGIDTDYFKRTNEVLKNATLIEDRYNLKNTFVFIFVGRVVKDKGINELLSAFNRLSQEYNTARLLLIGDFEKELDPLSDDSYAILKNNEHIIHTGFQADIRPFLATGNCFVLPTYREGFPNVVLQACSMELPCIVTDINGCNEIIANEKNGLLIEPKNTDDLYLAMKRMITEDMLPDTLKVNTRKDIIAKYDRQKFHQYLLDEYHEVLSK
jgi:glycosyltransferase involved in cell wall biosynthesis